MILRQVSGNYQRLAYIINDYQGVHFERLSFSLISDTHRL